MARAIGIDLGTTNSAACVVEGGEPRILLNTYNEELTPSIVAFQRYEDDERGDTVVGTAAREQAKLFARDTIVSIKRLMGRPFSDANVQKQKERVSYEIVEAEEPNRGLAAVRMGGQVMLPQEVSGLILADIKRSAEVSLGEPVTHAVITVPAYFGEPERAATRDAGHKAGLVVKTLLAEPTAAALAFGTQVSCEEGKFVLVYDMGGGTFDISILSLVGNSFNVMEVSGDHFLGGDDFDDAIAAMIMDHMKAKCGVDLGGDFAFRIVAKRAAEQAKKALSGQDSAVVLVPEAAKVDGKVINIHMQLTRADFERTIRKYVDRAKELVLEALKHQCLTPELISDVLLVGGSTAIPLVANSMVELFGQNKIRRNVNPMQCVALGAGILAARMAGIECPTCTRVCDESERACASCGTSLSVAKPVVQGLVVTEITHNHFGIQAVLGMDAHAFKCLVEKNTPIPMTEPKVETFYTTEERQALIRVPVYEGVGSSVLQNTQIGVIQYNLPAELPKGHAVFVGLQLDRQSIVKVTIEVEGKGFRHEQELTRAFDSGEPPARAVDDEKSIMDDEEIDEGTQDLVILERFVERCQHFSSRYEQVLNDAQRSKIEKAIEDAQRALDEDRAKDARTLIFRMDRLLNMSGTASLIYHTQLAAYAADEQTAGKLNLLHDQMMRAAEEGNRALLEKLREPAAALIRQVESRAADIKQVEGARTFGGLLAVKDRIST
jgi:molecular chaperone DnaK